MNNIESNPNRQNQTGLMILACLRPEKLSSLIEKISTFSSRPSIFVFVDLYEGTNSKFKKLNEDVIRSCEKYYQSGIVKSYLVSEKNVKTKKAWHDGMKFAFKFCEFCVYVEDDLIVNEDFFPLLNSLHPNIKKKGLITLFPPFSHSNCQFIKSDWPSLWGVAISNKLYSELYELASRPSLDYISTVVNTKFSKLHFKRTKDQKKFAEIWTGKFDRSFNSLSAWDTELHFRLWEHEIEILQTARRFVFDSGLDEVSVSNTRSFGMTNNEWHEGKLKENQDEFPICLDCEAKRYFSNGLDKKWSTILKNLIFNKYVPLK